jgi:hypothetical protein
MQLGSPTETFKFTALGEEVSSAEKVLAAVSVKL